MINKMELTQIVKLVQSDKGKFEQLYSLIVNKVYYWCFTIANNEAMAKDMTQEAMIRIYNKIDILQDPEHFNSWMYRLVRNSCMNYLQKVKGRTSEYLYDDVNENMITTIKDERTENIPDEAYSLQETKELIRGFVEELPNKQKEVIVLYYLEEFKTIEIANILGSNLSTIRSLLHKGRKSLETQISDYQIKNNVRLYSTIVLPLLGAILQERSEEISSNHNLQYDSKLYSSGNSLVTTNLVQVLSSKMIVAIVSVVCVTVIGIAVIANVLSNPIDSKITEIGVNESLIKDLGLFKKLMGHPYIEDITYLTFPMRSGVDVTIKLKKDLKDEDIQILFNDEELSFKQDEKGIHVQAVSNGMYTVVTKEYKTSFEISNIDEYAPELVEIIRNDNYIQLVVNDEKERIDYSKSYIEYEGEIYYIPKDLKIYGEFNDVIKITIYNFEGIDIQYTNSFK